MICFNFVIINKLKFFDASIHFRSVSSPMSKITNFCHIPNKNTRSLHDKTYGFPYFFFIEYDPINFVVLSNEN